VTLDFIRGLASGVLLAMAAVAAIWYVVDRSKGRHARPLAERIVDWLYWLAIRLGALAQAADRGLVGYRAAKAELLDGHTPDYAEAN
jgi:uncharacterized membrane-anchored protein